MATTRSPNRSPDETADPTPLIGSSSDESNSGRRILRAPSLQQAARFLRQASGRRLMREPSMMVRETAAEQLEERQSDWAYSKPVVILDILWNFAFIVAAVAVLILSIDESPSSPLRLWISGYALQCVVHVVCVCFEFRRRMQVREQLVINGGNAVGGGSGGSGDLGFDSMDGSGQYVNLEQNGDDGSTSSMAKHLESANTMFSFIWWVIGFYWVSADGQDLIHDSPNLYWLCIVFLGFDVLFVVFCIALACIIGIAVCCCLPCIIALLYAVADQFGSSDLRRVQISTKTVMMKKSKKVQWFWTWVIGSVLLRLILVYFPKNLNLSSRPEVSTPLTSIRRLAEGYWLKQSSMSPYAGSMYHGSPLLLTLLGPLTVTRIEGQPDHLLCSLLFVMADIVTAMLICATGKKLQAAYSSSLQLVGLHHLSEDSDVLPSGDFAALVYLWNPFTIVACVGLSTSAIENLMVLLTLYGACARLAPLAAFGWVMATHLSLYPAILIIPVILLFGYGPDAPPRKLFRQRKNLEVENSTTGDKSCLEDELINEKSMQSVFSWRPVVLFLFWTLLWSSYVLFLCGIYVQQHGGLQEMFKRTYGFILTIQDLSPNIGVFWYFFAEVFDFFRSFFLIVFHGNILLMIVPLALRLNHRPCFLAFVYIVLASMLKSYPSVGDSALYLGLLGLFAYELKDMQFSFFLFSGYVGVSLLSPVMHNLWIWRGTGNANFYFATAIGYACLQIILVIESVSAMLNHDRMITKLSTAKLQNVKS